MTRAEERAIDAWAIYEYREHPKGLYHTCFVDGYKEGYEQAEKDLTDVAQFSSGPDGFFYGKGYQQAKKDLALSIDDIEKIHTFLYAVKNNKHGVFTFTRLSDEQYKEVLRRFNKAKEEKK